MGKTRRFRGAGYLTDVQYLGGPLSPVAGPLSPVITSQPTAYDVRPVMYASPRQVGGKTRRARGERKRGGFSPSVMGSFVAKAQAAIVPLALYLVYHTTVPKTGSKKGGKGGKSRKNTRKNRK
jgi:hypothetical protein